jgi:hypothetical protein
MAAQPTLSYRCVIGLIEELKMKHPWIIEVHKYAPEMNKAYRLVQGRPVLIARATNGGLVAKGFDSIKTLRDRFRPARQGVIATVRTHYPDSLKWLERTYCGYVDSRTKALEFARDIKSKLAEGGSLSVKTESVG